MWLELSEHFSCKDCLSDNSCSNMHLRNRRRTTCMDTLGWHTWRKVLQEVEAEQLVQLVLRELGANLLHMASHRRRSGSNSNLAIHSRKPHKHSQAAGIWQRWRAKLPAGKMLSGATDYNNLSAAHSMLACCIQANCISLHLMCKIIQTSAASHGNHKENHR